MSSCSSDVCDPMPETLRGGARFFVTFKDDASGFRHVYFMKHKSDVLVRFKEFERAVANKFGKTIKTFRSDNGTEYCSHGMREYLTSHGIRHERTAPYTPQKNGRAERDNRTIVECARTMLNKRKLPRFLWAEAVNAAVHLLNRVTVVDKKLAKAAYEIWYGRKPDLGYVKIYDSLAYANIPK